MIEAIMTEAEIHHMRAEYASRIDRLAHQNRKLLKALSDLCGDEQCDCDDWMVTPFGSICKYCAARSAIREAEA